MGQNFDDYLDFQPKITHPKTFQPLVYHTQHVKLSFYKNQLLKRFTFAILQ